MGPISGVGKFRGEVASTFVCFNASAADIEVPKKVMFLHNPTAGASHPNAETLLKGIRKAIGVRPSYFSIKNADWKDALSKRWDAVILAGGDGTVGKSVRWLRDRKTPIAILPLGTANNIARSLGIEGDLESLLSKLPTASARSLDVGRATGPWGKRMFLEALGWVQSPRVFPRAGHGHPSPFDSIWRVRIYRNS
jgi:Diacylglycerol kinase catalytic domain